MSLTRSIFRTQLSSRVVRAPFAARTFTSYPRALSHSDYGSGKGDPKGEDPQAQGSSASEHLEHPGPESPASKGKSSGSTDPSSTPPSSSSSSSSKDSSDKETKGAKPKILDESAPAADEQSQDVKQHNKEMDNRAEKSHEKADDYNTEKQKVGKEFWAGQGGRDRDP